MSVLNEETWLDLDYTDDAGTRWQGSINCRLTFEPRGRSFVPVEIEREFVEDLKGNKYEWFDLPREVRDHIDELVEDENCDLARNRR